MAILGAVTFSEFFVLALYLQEVLHYSAVQSGVAFVGFALTVVVVSNLAQIVVGRVGVRDHADRGVAHVGGIRRLPDAAAGRRALLLGHVPGLRPRRRGYRPGVRPGDDREPRRRHRADAGIASGLVNTSRQIGGAIGIAATTAIASSSTAHFGGAPAGSAAALDHGYQTALYVLTGLLVVGAALTGALLRTPAPAPVTELRPSESRPVSEAA